MRILHNIPALFAHRQLLTNYQGMEKHIERLSSGRRINWAADDPAGLAVSELMKAQVSGLNQAVRNAQDGVSLVHTAEGALIEIHSILQRMRELAVQAANGTYTDSDRVQIQMEVSQLVQEVDRIANSTQFNTVKLLNGDLSAQGGNPLYIHVGANRNERVSLSIDAVNTAGLGIQGLTVATQEAANNALDTLDQAITKVASLRASLGAYQNRLEHTIKSLQVAVESTTAAYSRIADADMAKEMMQFVKYHILVNSGTAMLAQANLMPRVVLQLLGS